MPALAQIRLRRCECADTASSAASTSPVAACFHAGRKVQKLTPLQQLAKSISEQTQKVRGSIQMRDQLEQQEKLGSMQGIAASSTVRRDLNELAILAQQLQKMQQQVNVPAHI